MRTIMAEKDGSSPGGMDMMAHGFTVLPGEYTLSSHTASGSFWDARQTLISAIPAEPPGLGEWTGVLTSAPVPLRLVDQQVKTAKAGDSEAFGNRYMIAFDKGALKLRHYHGFPVNRRGGWEATTLGGREPRLEGPRR